MELRCRGYLVSGCLAGISGISDAVDKGKLALVWLWRSKFWFLFLARGPKLADTAEKNKKREKKDKWIEAMQSFDRRSGVHQKGLDLSTKGKSLSRGEKVTQKAWLWTRPLQRGIGQVVIKTRKLITSALFVSCAEVRIRLRLRPEKN